MMKRASTTLGDLFRVKHGYAFKGEFFSASGPYLLLTPGNFKKSGGLKFKGEKEKFYVGEFPKEYLLARGDLIIAMTDLKQDAPILGSTALVPDSGLYLHNQRLGKVVEVSENLVPPYLYYLLNDDSVRSQLRATASGATVRHTSPDRIYDVKVSIPFTTDQLKIAATLLPFDQLIDNNTRRIQVLEEMVQLRYQAWIAELHGSPGRFSDIAEEIRIGINPTQSDPETPLVGLGHIPRRSITLMEWGSAAEVTSRKWTFEQEDILFGRLRPYFHKVVSAPTSGLCSTDIIVMRPDPAFGEYPLMLASSDEFVAHAVSTSSGTDRPRAKWLDMADFSIAIPAEDDLRALNAVVRPLRLLARNLARQSQAAASTRDLLSARLLSGEVDPSGYDIDTSWTAA